MGIRTFRTLRGRLLLAASFLFAAGVATAADDFLDPEIAFKLEGQAIDARAVELVFTVAPGYYLYREQFKVVARGATLGSILYPPGKVKFDETFQKTVETHRDTVRIRVAVEQADARFKLAVTNQGCADKGLCYPPMERVLDVGLKGFGGDGTVRVATGIAARAGAGSPGGAAPTPSSETRGSGAGAQIDAALHGGKFWPVVGVFFLAGVLLSLTPCVLPMIPILSSIIVGHGAHVSRGRGLGLATSYSLGMAAVYTALGVAAGLAGEGLAAALQTPWVLGAFAIGLVLLALSMFGVYELRLPAAFTGKVAHASQRLPSGRLAGVFAMGGISALIVSPCVAAPLAGALVYLSQTRDVVLGGTALFSLAAGMSVPLLLVGASAGALLPKAGDWMNEVKNVFGLLLLGVAVWTVQSVLPGGLVLVLWGALAMGAAALVISGKRESATKSPWRVALAAVLAVGGLMQFVGAGSGGTNPLQPLAHLRAKSSAEALPDLTFTPVRSLTELDAALRAAGKPVVLDFYADWCVSCKEMERFTYTDERVRKRMSAALLLKADVTANNDQDRELLKRFQLFGPPGTLFFNAQGSEVSTARTVGFQNADQFLRTLGEAGL